MLTRVYKHILIVVFNAVLVQGLVTDEEDWTTGVSQWSTCSWGYTCMPLNSCTILRELVDSSCLNSYRARKLVCGYRNGEALVCCPDTCRSVLPTRYVCGSQPVLTGSQLAFPWIVRVSFISKETGLKVQLCVGSIISRRVILTAAHCALAKTKTHKISSVMLGSGSACCGREVALSHVVLHPAYKPTAFAHNIALLVLKQPLNYSRAVQPVCLPSKNGTILYSGQRSVMAGWGRLSTSPYVLDENVVDKQEMVDLPLLPNSKCSAVFGQKVKITNNMICAGGEGRDACSGFGGAPLVVTEPGRTDKYYQVGLMSFGGDKCGIIGVPSVFTNVESYLSWIQANSPQDPSPI